MAVNTPRLSDGVFLQAVQHSSCHSSVCFLCFFIPPSSFIFFFSSYRIPQLILLLHQFSLRLALCDLHPRRNMRAGSSCPRACSYYSELRVNLPFISRCAFVVFSCRFLFFFPPNLVYPASFDHLFHFPLASIRLLRLAFRQFPPVRCRSEFPCSRVSAAFFSSAPVRRRHLSISHSSLFCLL